MTPNKIYRIREGSPAESQGQPEYLMVDEVSEDGVVAWVIFSQDCINWRPHSIDRGVAWIMENYDEYEMGPEPVTNRLAMVE